MKSSKTGAARVVAMLCAAVFAVAMFGAGAAGAATKTTVKVTKVPDVGAVIADPAGKTLYTLTDANGAAVECTGSVPVGVAGVHGDGDRQGEGAQGREVARHDSDTNQVTWKDLPLYTFSGDDRPEGGQGQGLASFGGTWTW